MSVIRVEKTKNYTTMSNYHFKEKQMSLKAKGLLSLMLSLPDDWDYTISGLVSICKESESAIKTALNELKQFGYLKIIKNTPTEDNGGRINYEYIVYEKPIQEGKKQGVENLPLEILEVENPVQLNTKKLNTNNKKIDNNKLLSIVEQEETKKISKEKFIKENTKCIIDYLNEVANTKYKYNSKETLKLISARFNDGFVLDDFYDVIDNKYKDWHNTEFEKYLRPATLFSNKHFEEYLNQKVAFKGKPKTSYSSQPTFDNTANHKITRKQLNINDLAKDNEGNLLKF